LEDRQRILWKREGDRASRAPELQWATATPRWGTDRHGRILHGKIDAS
jgi:hypothetical protein